MDSQSNNPRIDEIVANNFASDATDVHRFEEAMKDDALNIPWEEVQRNLGLKPR